MDDNAVEAFREVNLSDGKCNVSLYVCAEEEKKIDSDPDYASELFKAALEGRLPAAGDDSETAEMSDSGDNEVNEKETKKKALLTTAATEHWQDDSCGQALCKVKTKDSYASLLTGDVEWDSPATRFFLKIVQKNCNLLPLNTGNRKRLFKRVQDDLLAEGYDIPIENIRQKFNSLVTTYNRIQFKAKRIGKVNTRWEFYELFDEIMKQADVFTKSKNGVTGIRGSPDIKEEPDLPQEDSVDHESLPVVPVESLLSPMLAHSDSSNVVSREASPVPFQVQAPIRKAEFPPKSKSEVPAYPVNKKRKLSKDDEEKPVSDSEISSKAKEIALTVFKKNKDTSAKKQDASRKYESNLKKQVASIKKELASGKKQEHSTRTEGVVTTGTDNSSMGGSAHIVAPSGEGFNHAATLLFIDCLKKNKEMLKTKHSAEMFCLIRANMEIEGFSFTEEKLRKKWYNLLISYRRILERANETGDLVSNWPYYEALDSIIADTKDIAQNRMENDINGNTESFEASYFKTPPSEHSRLRGTQDDGNTSCFVPKRRRGKVSPVLDILNQSSEWPSDTNNGRDDSFQRIVLEEWEQREQRREERDIMKLNVLQKIAKSMEAMTRKQDTLINLLKKL